VFGCLRSCTGRVVLLLLLVAAAYVGWRWGPAVFPRVEEWLGGEPVETVEEPSPTPELADSVMGRVQAFREGQGEGRMALGGREITSVLRYTVPGLIPRGVQEPVVRLRDDRVDLRARVSLGSFPELPDLGPVLGMLPDTVDVELEASLMPFGREEAALLVHGLEASRIPLPRRMIPEILSAIGRAERGGLPPDALAVPLPAGVSSAYVLSDSLILTRGG